jgi:hypothetical protein
MDILEFYVAVEMKDESTPCWAMGRRGNRSESFGDAEAFNEESEARHMAKKFEANNPGCITYVFALLGS